MHCRNPYSQFCVEKVFVVIMHMTQDFALSSPPESYTTFNLLSVMFPDISMVMKLIVQRIEATPILGFFQKIIHNSVSTCTEQRLSYGSQQAGVG
jgi:hypothetical protein